MSATEGGNLTDRVEEEPHASDKSPMDERKKEAKADKRMVAENKG